MDKKVEISVVAPVYRSAAMLKELIQRITKSVSPLTENFEVILVEDGSPDNAWAEIAKANLKDKRVRGIKFSRNFGQHNALTAGLDMAKGSWVVMMDSDLQDRPEEIPRLYDEAQKGFEVVLARRGKRKDSMLKKLTNRLFYLVFNLLTGMKYDNEVGGYRIMSQKVVEQLRLMREQYRFVNGLILWAGFKTSSIEVTHAKREEGKSSYSFLKLIKMAAHIITSYSNRPLHFFVSVGFAISSISFVFGIYYLVKVLKYGSTVSGWASLIISLYFLSGIIIMVLGVVGLYIGKIFTEVRKRPLYIISKTTDNE